MIEELQLDFTDRARTTDPETSHAAGRSLRNLTARRTAVLNLLRTTGPMADHEIAAAYIRAEAEGTVPHQSPSGLRTRRSELVDAGLLRDSGERTTTPSGRQAIIWESIE
jgi:hypothetical protein